LIVLVPAFNETTALWTDMRRRLATEIPEFANARWLCIDHYLKPWLRGRLDDIAHTVRDRIDEEWAKAGDYDEMVLIGHSVGGVLVRQAYLLAAGAERTETVTVPWASSVRQMILFAAVNRGVDVASWDWYWRLGGWLLEQLPGHFMALDMRRGSPFIANLRINWMQHFHVLQDSRLRDQPPPSRPRIVQFLGDTDTFVKRADSKDVLAFKNGRYLEIAGAGHKDLYRLEPPYTNDPEGRFALIRYGIREGTPPPPPDDTPPAPPIDRIVFVLHGIRALTSADWISALGTEIRDLDQTQALLGAAPGSPKGATLLIHPEYGWLTAARFALPFFRHRYLAWFADQYAEAVAQYPGAQRLAIAHSNGTYILGQNLRRLSGMSFTRIILAGSVLPVDFSWDNLRAQQQVSAVQNYRANHDWPVGLLCAGLRALGFTDVGTGGFEGFYGSTVKEVAYLKGGHSAAFATAPRRSHVIRALLSEQDTPTDAGLGMAIDPTVFRTLSHLMGYIAWGLVLGVGLLGLWIWRGGRHWLWRLLCTAGGLFIVYIILDII
jgi:hypothetical protein